MDPSPEPLWCPNCRSRLRADDLYCWKCGAGRRQEFPASRQPQGSGADGRRRRAIGLILTGSIFALFAGSMVFEAASVPAVIVLGTAAVGCCLAAGWVLASRP